MSRCIAVLSLPRSGSSAVAGALHRMGIDMGQGHFQPIDASNEKGYYEDMRWQAIHKEIAGYRYNVRPVWGLSERHERIYWRLAEECSEKSIWGMKGPRMAFTFKWLHPIVSEHAEVRMVCMLRKWDETVDSLRRHSQVAYGGTLEMSRLRAEKLLHTWDNALVGAIKSFDGPQFTVEYSDLVEYPEKTVEALAGFCFEGMKLPNLTEAIGWIDPEMRHHQLS